MKKMIVILLAMFAAIGLAACQEDPVVLDGIQVTAPTKAEYVIGDEFDAAGMVVKALYSDGTEETLAATDYTVAGFSSTTAGLVTVTVTYEGKTATFGVAVFNPDAPAVPLSISVKSVPDKQHYLVTEAFDATGLEIEVTYSTGTKEILDAEDYTLDGFIQGIKGKYTVIVEFEGLRTSFPAEVKSTIVQGVTDTEVVVGNTAVAAGPLAFVGLPFIYGMKAAFEVVNEAGGIAGRTITYVNRDDGFDVTGVTGLNNTKQLVEEDDVFALVGHFGTFTVNATASYIREVGIPMVYAATGVMTLFKENAPLEPMMPVQPIFFTDGRIATARALGSELYGANGDAALPANAKVGVLYTQTDDGIAIKAGVEVEARQWGKNDNFIYSSFSASDIPSLTTAISNFQTQGVQAIIVASNQVPFKAAIGALNTQGMTAPVFTSYVNADPTAVDVNTDYGFDIYTNAWLDVTAPENANDVAAFVAAINGSSDIPENDKAAMAANAFAIAGYVAAQMFIQGLERVGTDELTWESFIKAMESAPVSVPMGGAVNFADGMRLGISEMALLKYQVTTVNEVKVAQFIKQYDIENLENLRG